MSIQRPTMFICKFTASFLMVNVFSYMFIFLYSFSCMLILGSEEQKAFGSKVGNDLTNRGHNRTRVYRCSKAYLVNSRIAILWYRNFFNAFQ